MTPRAMIWLSVLVLGGCSLGEEEEATVASNMSWVSSVESDLSALEARVSALETDLATANAEIASLRTDTDATAAAAAANATGIEDNATAIGDNTSATVANGLAVGDIEANYLPTLDDLFLYLSVDTTNSVVSFLGADVLTDGNFDGGSVIFRTCGGNYTCTPMDCLAECVANGERMATVDELYAWASGGNNACGHAWMLDGDELGEPVSGFPMYADQSTTNCGVPNTGDVPRIELYNDDWTWDSTQTWNCACASLQ